MADPELEIKYYIETIDYINDIVAKLEQLPKQKYLKDHQELAHTLLTELLVTKEELTKEVNKLSAEIVQAAEVLAEIDKFNY